MKTILIVLAVLIVAVGAFLMLRDSDDAAVTGTPSPSASAQASPTPTPLASPSVSGTPARTPSPTPRATTSPAATTHNVTIQSFAFAPKTLTVKKGDIVKFTNKDSVGHTATDLSGKFDSGMLAQNQSYNLNTATLAAGTYEYKCTPHPSMRGTLIVQ